MHTKNGKTSVLKSSSRWAFYFVQALTTLKAMGTSRHVFSLKGMEGETNHENETIFYADAPTIFC